VIFTYWAGPDGALPSNVVASVSAWRSRFPEFKVFSDVDAVACLKRIMPEYVGLYNRIRLPACKSDVARLLLLHEYGGLYVDAHVGPGDGDRLARILSKLANYELIVFEKVWERKDADDVHAVNTVLAARRSTEIVPMLILSAMLNLSAHAAKEAVTVGYVPYNIYVLTGAWDLSVRLFDRSKRPIVLKDCYAHRVYVQELNRDSELAGLLLYAHYGYRAPGQHWSERQQHERLFL
jgi:hypothetical protein